MHNETLGHRGHRVDPLYKIRKLLLTGAERVNEKGQDRVLLGLRAGYPVAEVRSLGWTLKSWRSEILAHHDTGASNGSTEGLIIWSRSGYVSDVAHGA